jgi:hypothetical protein
VPICWSGGTAETVAGLEGADSRGLVNIPIVGAPILLGVATTMGTLMVGVWPTFGLFR